MLPVSGALQLNASGAIHERPMISHSGAYSRLVRPAPSSDSGRKRFHRPAARAFALRSSMTFVGTHDIAAPAVGLDLGGEHRFGRIDVVVHEARQRAPPRSFTFAECAKSMSIAPLDASRCAMSHATSATILRAAALLERVRRRRVALQRAREHAVQDRRDAEHVEDQVELPVRDARAAGARGNRPRRTRPRSGCRAPRSRSP